MRRVLAFFLPTVAVGIVLLAYPLMMLSLVSQGRVIFQRTVRPGDTFQLGYLHSVAKSDVWDTFQVDSRGRILLLETRFQGQAYGLPGGPAEGGKWTREGDWFRIQEIRRVVPSIDWRIQPEWKDRFRFREEPVMDLSARVGDGLVHLRVERVRLGNWLGSLISSFGQSGS